jgi:hypothetical protein
MALAGNRAGGAGGELRSNTRVSQGVATIAGFTRDMRSSPDPHEPYPLSGGPRPARPPPFAPQEPKSLTGCRSSSEAGWSPRPTARRRSSLIRSSFWSAWIPFRARAERGIRSLSPSRGQSRTAPNPWPARAHPQMVSPFQSTAQPAKSPSNPRLLDKAPIPQL